MIAGLEDPDSGVVEIDGVDLTHLPPQRRNVGFVFQHYAAFKHMTVAENIAFGLEIRKRTKGDISKRVNELLELVHLEQFGDRYPAQLSGGQRQRMALARALAVEPEVLLLDEPFGALDAKVREELRDWLRRLHEEVHVTTVFVTHDQEEAHGRGRPHRGDGRRPGRADRHARMTCTTRPANDFVMSFLGPVTKLDGQLSGRTTSTLVAPGTEGSVKATIIRVARLGFEIRVECQVDGADPDDPSSELWVQLTRGEAENLTLSTGGSIGIRANKRPILASA